jgi:hypothetical protein
MGTEDKKSLIVLREKHQVERYIDEIIREDMPARIVIDNAITIDNASILLRNGNKFLVLEAPLIAGEYPESGLANVTFAGSTSLYKFHAAIIALDIAENRRMRFTLQFPDRIMKRERRKHVRVKPSTKHAVIVRLSLAHSEIDAQIADISQGGISFTVTEYVTHFRPGDAVDLVIHIPRYDKLSAGAIIRNVIHLMDLTRIGAEFSGLSNSAVRIIMDYIAQCETFQPEAYEDE